MATKTTTPALIIYQDEKKIKAAAEVLKSLTRRVPKKIVEHLAHNGTCQVNQIYNTIGEEQSTTSQSLKSLKRSGIVTSVRDGKKQLYSLHPERLDQIKEIINQL